MLQVKNQPSIYIVNLITYFCQKLVELYFNNSTGIEFDFKFN